ncbi:60S ribosomal protein L34B [Paraphaeosphaeria minitans]
MEGLAIHSKWRLAAARIIKRGKALPHTIPSHRETPRPSTTATPAISNSSVRIFGNTIKMPSTRLTYRRRAPYNTTSNNVRVIKTPGGQLRYLHIKKKGTAPKCGDCGTKLPGIPALRPREYATISRPKKTVQRAYGGSRCANCVQDRIVRAFLIEEQKVVKKVLKESQQKKR